jgi:hypothetical protein
MIKTRGMLCAISFDCEPGDRSASYLQTAMNDTFDTYDGAIEASVAAAYKWIDEGKPAI